MFISNTFLVGGAVRDKLLCLKVNEFDWLVVNTKPDSMINQGFKRVGKDFPVFLHPFSKEEYALARKEKKIGKGYYGFKCDFSIYVSLSEDLFRRDLTINSLSLDKFGNLIDFFSGVYDLEKKKITHVSFAFFEDPLRVLRVFRFFVKYSDINFYLSSYINSFIRKILLSGEIFYLTLERILKEIFLSLQYKNAFLFFKLLHLNGLLKNLFYDFDKLLFISDRYYFNCYLNFSIQLDNLFCKIHLYTNNMLFKFALLFFKLTFNILFYHKFNMLYFYNRKNFLIINRYSNIFNLSKKYVCFLLHLNTFKFVYANLIFINNYYLYLFLLKINALKDKIKSINYIFINDLDAKIHDKVYDFHYKYFLLDLLNEINSNRLILFSKVGVNRKNYFEDMYLKNVFYSLRFFYNKNKFD